MLQQGVKELSSQSMRLIAVVSVRPRFHKTTVTSSSGGDWMSREAHVSTCGAENAKQVVLNQTSILAAQLH
jgi:hypothetical protein